MLIHKIIGGIMISHIRRSYHFCCSNRFATRQLSLQTSTLKQKRSNKLYRLEALLYQHRQQSSVSYMMAEPQDSIDRSQRQTYDLSDILKYLDQIEDILQCDKLESSPAFMYQHCYPGDDKEDKQTFYKVVGNVLAKPMLRTLIYGDINVNKENTETAKTKKIHFDRRIRESRVRIEGERMCMFILNSLKPAALQLDIDLRDTMAPNLLSQMDMIESQMNRDKSSPIILTTGSSTIFSRLASGRHYQGKLDLMIGDLFPSLLGDYNQASQKATEREMMEYVIQHDLVHQQTNDNDIDLDKDEEAWIKKQQEWREKRINAAYKCLDRFYPLDAEQSTSSEKQNNLTEEGLQSGKRCEDSCIAYLTYERDLVEQEQYTVLQNVYVNNRRGKETKYVPPKILKTPKDMNGTGIIWAENLDGGGRHRLCSEFDAVVVSSDSIESVFEAKKTISPSTIHDILSKKLGAVNTLLEDRSAELVYGDGEITRTIPFTSTDSTRFTFGMYGTELQRPEHSADSIRSIAGSYVVSSDVGEIIRALDDMSDDGMVMVEVELTSALSIIESLRSLVKEVSMRRVDVVLIIDKPIDFL